MENLKLESKDFFQCVKESRALALEERIEVKKIERKDILKQRLIGLYVCGVYTNRQIGDILCISTVAVNKLLRSKEILEQIQGYQGEEKAMIDSRLKALRSKATETMFDLLDSEEDTVRLQSAKDILDRTGHAVKKEQDINVNVSYEQRLTELVGSATTEYIDTTYTEGE